MPNSPFKVFEGDIGTVIDITVRKQICDFTVIADDNLVLAEKHGLVDDDTMYLFTDGDLPANLFLETLYHVISAKRDQFQLSISQGGSVIDIIDAGRGVNTLEAVLDITGATMLWFWQHGKKTPVTKAGTIQDGPNGVTRYTTIADDIEAEDLRIQVDTTLPSGWHGRTDQIPVKVGRKLIKGL